MDNTYQILLVEDEIGISNFIKQGLAEEGYLVDHTMSGEKALWMMQQKLYDLILLDWMILNLSGIEVCKAIRSSNNQNQQTPIMFITAKDTPEDTILGLKSGANDYIKKPFHFDELLARIEVQLRKEKKKTCLSLGNITLNDTTHQVFVDHHKKNLTQKEFALLALLIKNKGIVCTRKQIIEKVWDIHFEYDTSVIDVFMNAIRKKLDMSKEDNRITTIRGVGYMAQDV